MGSGETVYGAFEARAESQVEQPIRAGSGPRILFFSGGSALDGVSRKLKQRTHNSIHLITPFDSGGSSARLRHAFSMLSVGDIRARLLSLADETLPDYEQVVRIFSHRLSERSTPRELWAELAAFQSCQHAFLQATRGATRKLIGTYLSAFNEARPPDFDLRGANLGNLLLAASYLQHNGRIDAVLSEFSSFLGVRGVVYPSCCGNHHLAVRLHSGAELVGQAQFSGKSAPPVSSPIDDVFFVDDLQRPRRAPVSACAEALHWIRRAQLICYPMGSFYSSVLCHFLLDGVCAAIAENPCPKVYVPNVGRDPEQRGMSLTDSVLRILEMAERACPGVSSKSVLDYVLLDSRHADYRVTLDADRVQRLGVEVLDLPLARTPHALDATLLSEALLSLC